ncbi:DUF3784 domain-containing protein [Acetivibrio clariflavus]|uniref:DUF3784 domain-containing protein n=1 Tax=Acetivibrio clariflavus TaxID=288965 RepID=UPI0004B90515|nr:DUF3784 domain-containing protein [Acetivibrio clariflavus]
MWFCMILGVFFIVMGLMVHVLKWHFLISGYNTMPKEKKAKVDADGLGRLIGIYFYINGGLLIVMGIFQALGFKPVLIPYLIFFGISTVYMLNMMETFMMKMEDCKREHGSNLLCLSVF